MKKSLFLIHALVFSYNLSYSQSHEIIIKFIGNCGLYMTDGEQHIYTDFPYKSGAYNYMEYEESELDSIPENSIFIFTHRHADHYAKKILKQLLPKLNGKKYGTWDIEELEGLSQTIPDFTIEAFKTKHRFALKHYSYLITWHGKKIFLSGDTESADTITGVEDIDWAFVPYWILLDAKKKGIKIDAEKIGLYHLYPHQTINNNSPLDILILKNQGEVISIEY